MKKNNKRNLIRNEDGDLIDGDTGELILGNKELTSLDQVTKKFQKKVKGNSKTFTKSMEKLDEELEYILKLKPKALRLYLFIQKSDCIPYVNDTRNSLSATRVLLSSCYGNTLDLGNDAVLKKIKWCINAKTERTVYNVIKEMIEIGLLIRVRPKIYHLNPYESFKGTLIAQTVCKENWTRRTSN